MKPLVDLMIETDSYERSLILEALSQVCSRTLRPMNQALAISLQDKNSQVRKNAIRDLTRLYDLMSQISELLCYALEDESIEVKETAKWALDKLNLRMPIKLNLGKMNEDDDSTFEEDDVEEEEEELEDTESFKR
jgi:HEAT repeat protein